MSSEQPKPGPGQGLLAFLKANATPKDQAEEAVKNDDAILLAKLLTDHSSEITETTSFRRNLDTNLLHLAVSQRSSQCVRLLVRQYNWNIHRRKTLAEDTVETAAIQCYLPIYWELLRSYKEPWARVRTRLSQSSPHFLLVDYLIWPDISSLEGFLQNFDGTNSLKMTPSPIYLLTELVLSTPNLPPIWSTGVFAGSDAQDTDFQEWSKEKRQMPLLTELCRRFVWQYFARLIGAQQMITQTSSDTPVHPDSSRSNCSQSSRENYFAFVHSLPVPFSIKDFLSFRELWPVQPRDVTTPYRRRGPTNRVRSIQLVYFDDVDNVNVLEEY